MNNYYNTKTEIAYLFGVSEGTVRNWIKRTINKELNLDLADIDGDLKIIKNTHNDSLINKLIKNGRKYRQLDLKEERKVSSKLEKLLSYNQTLTLINSIEVNKEVPLKFAYLGEGADIWNKFYLSTKKGDVYSSNNSDVFLLDKQYPIIIEHFAPNQKINVVDLGSGNGYPVTEILKKLKSENKLNSYVAIDISQKILDITKKNIEKVNLGVPIHTFIADFESQSLQDILYSIKHNEQDQNIPNLILMLGSTLPNIEPQIQPLLNIKAGMTVEDYLITSNAYDKPETRTSFPAFEFEDGKELILQIPKLLGLNNENCKTEKIYNQKKGLKEFNLVLQKDLQITFPKLNKTIKLYINDRINVWKYRRDTFELINKKCKDAELVQHFTVRNPHMNQIMYMVGIV